MSAPGRPKRELLPLGGTARSAKGAPIRAPGRPKRELLPLGGTARSAKGAHMTTAPLRFRPRLVPTIAALLVIVVGVGAGRWQQSRMHAKEVLRSQYDEAARAAPVALASLPQPTDWASLQFRAVVATGGYMASRQFFIDNRIVAGRAGFHVVTPLALPDGRVVLVNRGWVGQRASRSILPDAPPPAGEVTVTGRLSTPPAKYLELQPETTRGPIRQNLDPARFAAATGLAVLPVVVEATAAPVPDDGLVRSWPAPDFGVETHRIYMVQWYVFALLAAGLWLWFHRPRGWRSAGSRA